jgi:hypothetical protein
MRKCVTVCLTDPVPPDQWGEFSRLHGLTRGGFDPGADETWQAGPVTVIRLPGMTRFCAADPDGFAQATGLGVQFWCQFGGALHAPPELRQEAGLLWAAGTIWHESGRLPAPREPRDLAVRRPGPRPPRRRLRNRRPGRGCGFGDLLILGRGFRFDDAESAVPDLEEFEGEVVGDRDDGAVLGPHVPAGYGPG